MVVGHKNDSYPNKYTIKGKLVSSDNINDFLNEDFDTTFFQYQYTFNTNTTLYVNGLIEAHKGDYPYAESPYRAIVDGKLNLA